MLKNYTSLKVVALWLLTATSLFVSVPSAFAQVSKKVSLPTAAQKKQALAQLKVRFRSYYQGKGATRTAWQRLAGTLLAEADRQPFDPVQTYVRLNEARRLAVEAGDISLALVAIDSIGSKYTIDKNATRTKTFLALVDSLMNPDSFQTLSELLLQEISEARNEDDYDRAVTLVDIATKAARKTKSLPLALKIRNVRTDLVAAKKQYANITPFLEILKKDPTNPTANAKVGDYVCLRKGRWKRGLFLLAQSDDSNLRSLAQRDLARPDAHKDQIMLGNEWWTLADKRDGLVKTRLRQRATYWYQEALEKAEGELRKTLEKRIAMVPPIPGAVPPWDYFGKPGRIWQSVNSRTVYSVAFSPDGKYVTSGCSGDDVVFWDAKTGKETKRFRGHTSTIRAETFSPDGRHVYSASSDSTIRKWDVKTGRQVMQLPKQGRFGSFYGVDVSPDGRRVLGGCSNRTVMLFDAQTGKKLKTLSGHRGTVYAVKFFDKGRKAVSGSSGNRLIIWDLTTGRQIRTISARSSVRSIAVTPDNRYVIASEYSTTVRMWDIRTGQMVRQFAGNIGSVYSVAIAPDGKRLATAASGGRIGYWDLRTGRLLQTFQGHTGTIYHIAFSPGGGRLVSGSTGRQVCVWGLPRNP